MTSPQQESVRTLAAPALPPTAELKSQARRLRLALGQQGLELGHGQSLELLARLWGRRDWNTLHAAARAAGDAQRVPSPATVPWSLGQPVTGRAFGQSFTGRLVGMSLMSRADCVRVSVHLDQPLDMFEFDSAKSERHRFNAVIRVANGRSLRRRSDGRHQLELDLPNAGTDIGGDADGPAE